MLNEKTGHANAVLPASSEYVCSDDRTDSRYSGLRCGIKLHQVRDRAVRQG